MKRGSEMKGQALNILLVVVVVAIVAGAAWFRSHRAGQPASTGPAAPAGANEAPRPAVARSQPGQPRTTSEPGVSPAKPAVMAKLPRLVDLGAEKCVACKKMAPILEELREEYKGRLEVTFINVLKEPIAKMLYAIRVIPTQILFDKDGNELWRHEGYIAKEDLIALFAEKAGVK